MAWLWCLVRPHLPHSEHEDLSAPIFPGSELDLLAFKALIPRCCLSCLEGLAQAVTLSFQFLSCGAKGSQRLVDLPSHFHLGKHRYKVSHKKPEVRTCILVQFHMEFFKFSSMEIKIICLGFEQKLPVSAETERK